MNHRHPHLRRRSGEQDPLELLRSLPPGAAKEFERLLYNEHRGDRRFSRHQTLEAELPIGGIDDLMGPVLAGPFVAGGGRRRPTLAPSE